MVSHHPHRPPSAPTRLIVVALAVSVLLHIWLLTASVSDWTKVRVSAPSPVTVTLAPAPAAQTPEPAPTQSAPIPPPAITPRRMPNSTHRTPAPPKPAVQPRVRPPMTTKPPEAPLPSVQPAQPDLFNAPKTAVTRQPRVPKTPPSRQGGGAVGMDQLRSQLAGGAAAGDDDGAAPKARFSKIQMVYRSASCAGSCAGYAGTVFAHLNRNAGGARAQMNNGEIATARITAVVGPDGSVRSAYVAKSSGNSSVDNTARSQTMAASLPPFPADMAARASSLRLTFSWQQQQ